MQDHGLPSEEEMKTIQKDRQNYVKPESIHELKLHETMIVSGPDGSFPNELYHVTKVPDGWLYHHQHGSSYYIPPVFVPERYVKPHITGLG